MAINIGSSVGRLYRVLSMENCLIRCTYRYLSHLIQQQMNTNMKKTSTLRNFFINNARGAELRNTNRSFAKTLSVSEHKPVSLHEMKKFLNANKLIFEHGYTCLILSCPFCPYRTVNSSKPKKLYINIVTGMFLCHGCHLKGTWLEFQDYIYALQSNHLQGIVTAPKLQNGLAVSQEDRLYIDEIFGSSKPLESLQISHYKDIIDKFGLKGLNPSSCSKYEIRIQPDESRLILPIYDVDSTKAGLRFLSPKKLEGQCQNIIDDVIPKTARDFIFGWQKISSNHREVILTAFPLDAIIVNQEVGIPSLSLQRGITSLPQEVLPLLEQFKRIILWFGNKVSEWEAARMFAKKLGERRCFFIRPRDSNPRPLIAVQKHLKLSSILQECHPIGHKAITSFSSLREDVLAELSNAEQVAGIKWQRYPLLNKLLKGHRRGELTVVTGPTGSGKTTFISDYSLDLCIQGVNTLWGSFEIKNVRLAKMMLTQFAQISLKLNLDQYNYWADRFEQLPMYYMSFHGQQTLKNVLEAMTHAVYVHDIQHVIVDNLQFMMGTGDNESHFDRFWRQDQIISAFRKFATTNNIHVTLVIHPRKEREIDELNNLSIFGGAKASQEADNILILQDKRLSTLRGRKYIQVTKNRYDGDLGIMPLEFDKETLSFAVKKKPKKIDKSGKNVKENATE